MVRDEVRHREEDQETCYDRQGGHYAAIHSAAQGIGSTEAVNRCGVNAFATREHPDTRKIVEAHGHRCTL
jgi:hypothetical protein